MQIGANNLNFVGKDDRQQSGWLITSDRWKTQGAYLILPINPDNLEIGKRIRGGEVSMQGGKFVSVGRRTREDSVYEFPTISFKFNSGNIQPVFSEQFIKDARTSAATTLNVGGPDYSQSKPNLNTVGTHTYGAFKNVRVPLKTGMPAGLYMDEIPVGVQNLYAMLSLVNDRWMLDKVENTLPCSVLNRIIVNTNSLAFPHLNFYGFIDDAGLQWSETSENYNNFDLSFNLVVTHTDPSLNARQLNALIQAYKQGMYNPKYGAAFGPGDSGVCREPDWTPAPDPEPIAPSTPVVPLKQATWSDQLRAAVASNVQKASTAVDYYAERAKISFDPTYAAAKQQSDYQESTANDRFNNLDTSSADISARTNDEFGYS